MRRLGTPRYLGEKVMLKLNPVEHSFKADLFALGVIFYEIIIGFVTKGYVNSTNEYRGDNSYFLEFNSLLKKLLNEEYTGKEGEKFVERGTIDDVVVFVLNLL